MKSYLRESLYYYDSSLALKKKPEDVPGVLVKGAARWRGRVYRSAWPDAELTMKIELEGQRIVNHYLDIHGEYDSDRNGRYFTRLKRPVLRHLFEVALPSFERMKLGGASKHRFAFLFDGLYRGHKEPVLLVRHFTSNRNRAAVREDLLARMDVAGMAWAASKLAKKPVRTVEFDIIRTKPPSLPQLLKCKACGGEGQVSVGETEQDSNVFSKATLVDCEACAGTGNGGISAKACDTTVEIWEGVLTENAHMDQLHAREKAAKLLGELGTRGESFAYRIRREIADAEVDDWLVDAYERIRELEAAKKRGTWPRNHDVCIGRSGACPYRDICTGKLNDGQPAFKIVDDKYPGLITWAD